MSIQLTKEGITSGFNNYITKFNKANGSVFPVEFTAIKLDNNIKSKFGVETDKFENYFHTKIGKADETGKPALWFSRAQIMFAVLENFITSNDSKQSNTKISDLSNYELGIFGSMTPASDIDIGVSYTGDGVINIAGVIKAIEDIYVDVLECSTLNLDIEHYASMLQVDGNYLLDMDDFTPDVEIYKSFLTLASASIHRNYLKPENNAINKTPLTYETVIGYITEENRLPELQDMLPQKQEWFSAGATIANRMEGQTDDGIDDYK